LEDNIPSEYKWVELHKAEDFVDLVTVMRHEKDRNRDGAIMLESIGGDLNCILSIRLY